MELVLQQLSCSMVLSKEDLYDIKKTISEKYAKYSSAVRASFLAQSLHSAVEKALLGIEEGFWPEIKRNLFQNTLARQKEEITKKDVFEEIILLELPANELNLSTFRWLLTQKVESVDPGALGSYIHTTWQLKGKTFPFSPAKTYESETMDFVNDVEESQKPITAKIKLEDKKAKIEEIEMEEISLETDRTELLSQQKLTYHLTALGWVSIVAAVAILAISLYLIM